MGAGPSASQYPPSVIVSAGSGENGAIRRAGAFKDELKSSAYPGEVVTCYDAFQRGLRYGADSACLGYRPVVEMKEVTNAKTGAKTQEAVVGDFSWFTYKQVQEKIDNLGSGIVHLGLAPANDLGHKLIGIYAKNRWEWSVTQQAAFAFSMSTVPLYDTLGAEALAFIVQQAGLVTVFCSKADASKVVGFKRANAAAFETLRNLVQFEDVEEAARTAALEVGVSLRSFAEVSDAGAFNKHAHVKPAASDIAVICYTSGTTGNPKGAVLTHKVMIADCSAAKYGQLGINSEDIHLSYLPLAHVFEQLIQNVLFMEAARIGFYQGDTLKILEDIKTLRPTIFPSVPRLFNRIYDKIMGGVAEAGGVKASLFHQAFAAKQYWLKQNHLRHSFWDGLVFKPVATRVVEGYGQTECGGAATVQNPYDQATIGHVGGPLACNEIKLVSVPDLEYLVTDTVHGRETDKAGVVTKPGLTCEGRGEVCYRGPNVFPGYYKDEEKTREAIDAEGWLHSGDIGIWLPSGYLKIVDRKKNMFKLSQGEYVAAEKIENVCLSNWVQQIFVYGDSFHSMLVAVVVVNPDTMAAWAKDNGHATTPLTTLCADPAVKTMILKDMQAKSKAGGLQGFEVPKDIVLESEPWTPENILTPTFKLKRADAKKRYQADIDRMYTVLDPVAGMSGIKQ